MLKTEAKLLNTYEFREFRPIGQCYNLDTDAVRGLSEALTTEREVRNGNNVRLSLSNGSWGVWSIRISLLA